MPLENQRPVTAHWFLTTHWSVVLAAGHPDQPDAGAALEKLCRAYWYPLYAFIRRQGHAPHDAQDLTQEFFARLFDKNTLSRVAREKGKFRSFLLACLTNFLSNARDRLNAVKRGGGKAIISLDEERAEERYQLEPATELTPAMIFERRWALTVLESALERLREEFVRSGRETQFARLSPFLEGVVAKGDYELAAADLNVTAGAVAMSVQRMRRRYREFVRDEIANTVASAEEVEAEMQHLVDVLAGAGG